jgi:hypothetical protein
VKTEGAHRRLGNLALAREQVRDVDTFRWLGDLGRTGDMPCDNCEGIPGLPLPQS